MVLNPLEAALAAISTAKPQTERDLLVAAKCIGLMVGYDKRWLEETVATFDVDGIEYFVESDLWNPETNRKSRSFRIAGILDISATRKDNGHRVIMDHKTTSDDIEDAAGPYWMQLVVEAQPSHYMLLEWLNGRKVDDAIWDVVRKPAIRPRKVSKVDASAVAVSGRYFNAEMPDASLRYLRENLHEDGVLYSARLAHLCGTEEPKRYFARRSVPRMDSELREWAIELWGHSQDVLYARRDNRWPKNAKACIAYSRPCMYLGICSGYDTPNSDKWIKKQQVHNELTIIESDGRGVLTNSRIGVFQLCRKKHYYQYELGIERLDEEEAEALYFGSLWHLAQAAWWTAIKNIDISIQSA